MLAALRHRDVGFFSSIAFDPQGTLLAAGGADGDAVLWRIGSRSADSLRVSSDAQVAGVAFDASGTVLATSAGSSIQLWHTASVVASPVTARSFRTLSAPPSVGSIAFSPTTDLLAGGARDSVDLWNLAAGTQQPSRTLTGQRSLVYGLAFSRSGSMLAAGTRRVGRGLASGGTSGADPPHRARRTRVRGRV
jgi:WD40 repeat protein